MKIVLASSNAGKLRELESLLGPLGFELLTQQCLGIESPPETGTTFTENALLKARYASGKANLPALADDSGIEVDALGGRPGVFSARYAGEGASDVQNLHKLLRELREVPAERRGGRYRCVIALVRTSLDPEPVLTQGTWEGAIEFEPRGAGGFGYDPIFRPVGSDCTAAELPAEEKNARSHRGQALRALTSRLGRQPL